MEIVENLRSGEKFCLHGQGSSPGSFNRSCLIKASADLYRTQSSAIN